jgi:hypothetical protein
MKGEKANIGVRPGDGNLRKQWAKNYDLKLEGALAEFTSVIVVSERRNYAITKL